MNNLVLPRGERFVPEAPPLLEEAFRQVDALLLSNAVLVGPVAIATTDTRIFHGLGQPPRGYFIVKASADVRIFDGAAPEVSDPSNYVTLRASSAQTVTLIIF